MNNTFKKLKKIGSAKTINRWYFSTLKTQLPHYKLIFVLNSTIKFCLTGDPCKYITITMYGAKWVEDNSE